MMLARLLVLFHFGDLVGVGPDRMAEMRQMAAVWKATVAECEPWIVRIDTVGGAQPEPGALAAGFRLGDGPTTGVIWTADGYIYTSNFNFLKTPPIITVHLHDDRAFVARLVAQDVPAHTALLKIDAEGLPPAPRTPRSALRAGQSTCALGFGHAGKAPTLSIGIVSAISRIDGIALQTDARISPANYGGPLIDLQGRMIGLCVPLGGTGMHTAGGAGAGVEWYDSGVGFAVHCEYLEARFEALKSGRTLQRGDIGAPLDAREPVFGSPATASAPADALPADGGVRVIGPPEGAAAAAGLAEGDVILSVNDIPTPRFTALRKAVARFSAGDEVTLTIRRGSEERRLTVTLEPESTPATAPAAAESRPAAREE